MRLEQQKTGTIELEHLLDLEQHSNRKTKLISTYGTGATFQEGKLELEQHLDLMLL